VNDEVYTQVRDAMCEMFELAPASVTREARLMEDLDLDSIDAIDMAVKMQEMTGIRVDDDALRKVRTVGDVVALLESLQARKT
jgi:acyl carrier protein